MYFDMLFMRMNIREAIERVQPDLIHVNSIANVSPVRFAIGKSEILYFLHVMVYSIVATRKML